MTINSRVLTVIPTYKECENLTLLIPELLNLKLGLDILVVDDFSDDGTIQLIETLRITYGESVKVISRHEEASYAKSLIQGIKFGIANGYSTVIQLDADGSHAPKDVNKLIEAKGDVVIGSRYVRNSKVINVPLRRQAYSILGNIYISLIWKSRVRDKTNGFRLFRTDALRTLDEFNVSSLGFAVQIQTLKLISKNKKIRISEVPTEFVFRQIGNSKFDLKKLLEALIITTKSV
jgi:dolichol-phosphate mannosyltransferase